MAKDTARVRSRTFAAAAALLTLLSGAALAAPLDNETSRLLAGAKLEQARVSLCAMDADRGELLAASREMEGFIPASNMKLLTSGAALLTLGPDFKFRTELALVNDTLVLRGDGDPALGDPEILERAEPRMSVDDLLDRLADAAQRSGISRLTSVVADDRVFDREYIHPSWPDNQLQNWYCAEVSGLTFHTNVLYFFPGPGRGGAGSTGVYTVSPFAPTPILEIENKLRTVKAGSNLISVGRSLQSNRFTLSGEVKAESQVPVRVTTHNSGLLLAQLMTDRLIRRGIPVNRSTQLPEALEGTRLADAQEDLSGGRTLAVVTTPMRDILRRCNQDSHNLYADALCKRTGHEITNEPGSWSNGGAVIRMLLSQNLGPEYAAAISVADGSGMSRLNTVTTETLVRWLASISKNPECGPMFVDSLAVPGEGTLRSRFEGVRLRNELHAKSGYIRGVRCLSGYLVNAATGRKVAFSALVNEAEGGPEDSAALRLHEDFVKMLDTWLSNRVADEAAPAVGG